MLRTISMILFSKCVFQDMQNTPLECYAFTLDVSCEDNWKWFEPYVVHRSSEKMEWFGSRIWMPDKLEQLLRK